MHRTRIFSIINNKIFHQTCIRDWVRKVPAIDRTSCSIHIRMKNGLEAESKKDGGLNGVFIPTLADEGCANIGLVIKIFVEILNGKLYERTVDDFFAI